MFVDISLRDFFLSFQQGDWLIHAALTSNLNDWLKITIKII